MPSVESKSALLFVGPQHTDELRRVTGLAKRHVLEALDPLGIAIVSAFLKRYGVKTRLIVMDSNSKADYSEQIRDVDAVFVSSREFDTTLAQRVIETASRLGKKTIVGGYGPTFNPDGFSAADTRVLGEAEPILDKLIDDWLSGRNLSPVYDSTSFPPFDLNGYVWPDRTIFPRSNNPLKQHPQEWQRGCGSKCLYCSPSRMQQTVRFRPNSDIIAEINSLGHPKGKLIFSTDLNTSSIPPEQLGDLFMRLKQQGTRWSTEGTVAPLIQEYSASGERDCLLALMSAVDPKKGGCYSFLYGADDLSSQKVRGSLDKHLADLQTAVDLFRKFAIPLNLSVVVGLENHIFPDSFFEIAAILNEISPSYALLHIATPLRGTPWGDSLRRKGRIFDENSLHFNHRRVVHQPKNMTAEQLQQGYYWLLKTIYSPAQVIRHFQKNFSPDLFVKNPFLALVSSGIHWQMETWASIKELTIRGHLNSEIQKQLDYEYRDWIGNS